MIGVVFLIIGLVMKPKSKLFIIGGTLSIVGLMISLVPIAFKGTGTIHLLDITMICSAVNILLNFSGIIVGIIGIFDAIKKNKKKKQEIEEESRKKQLEREIIEQNKIEERKNAVYIYNKCYNKKVNDFEKPENIEALRVIASSFGVEDIEEAKRLYAMGEQITAKEKYDKEQEIIIKNRNKDYKRNAKDEEEARIVGKIKYTKRLEEDIKKGMAAIEMSKIGEKIGRENMFATAKKSDWAFWGGMADGLVGPGAGIATAMDVQIQNAKAEENTKQLRASGEDLYFQSKAIQRNLPIEIAKEQAIVDHINEKLYDDKNIDEKIKLIDFSKIKYTILENKNFEVNCKVKVKENIKILDEPAVLDGSLRINIKDEDDNIVATGVYSAPGFNITELEMVGFNCINEFTAICITKDYSQIDNKAKYKCEIVPNYLWLIEQN